ncbi:MAG: D-alanine--D-alanine ligase family protein [Lachnospiraceae bacterium]|jgi:D-alanine-D-alanine ligase
MNIVVLAGGISTERDVSIVSGTDVCRALRSKGHKAILMDVYFGREDLGKVIFPEEYDVEEAAAYMKSFNDKVEETKKNRKEFFGSNVIEVCKEADMVFLALHGENGENGSVQAAFDLMGIRYTGTGHLSSGMAMDKGITKDIFRCHGVPTPIGTEMVKGEDSTVLADHGLELPVVIKPCCGGSSVGVFIVHTQEEYEKALQEAFTYDNKLIVEQYVAGREFSIGVLDGKALPIIEIAPIEGFYDYVNKYKAGSAVETCPAELTEEQTKQMQKYAEMGFDALGLQAYARLDFLMNEKGEMFCLEANTLPGMTPTSLLPQEAQAVGVDYPSLCEELIHISMKKYK